MYQNENLNLVLMKQIQNEMSRKINNTLKKKELTMPQTELLAKLIESKHSKMTLKELEKSLHLSQSVISEMVVRLENKEYIQICESKQDKRMKVVKMTKLGERRGKLAIQYIAKVERKMLYCLTKDERKNLRELLQKVWKNIE